MCFVVAVCVVSLARQQKLSLRGAGDAFGVFWLWTVLEQRKLQLAERRRHSSVFVSSVLRVKRAAEGGAVQRRLVPVVRLLSPRSCTTPEKLTNVCYAADEGTLHRDNVLW